MSKHTLKKMFSLLLAVLMLCSLCACGEKNEKEEEKTEEQVDEAPNTTLTTELALEANALIEAGDLEAAYLLLKDVEPTLDNVEAMYLRNKLVFVPTSMEDDGRVGFSAKYDDNGLPTYLLYYGEELFYTYDQYGNLLEESCIYTDAEERKTQHISYQYTYGKNGKPSSAAVVDNENGNYTITYTYDKYDRLISKILNNPGENCSEEWLYTYHNNNQIESLIYRDLNDYEDVEITTHYDKMGKVVLEIEAEEDEGKEEMHYSYDDHGRLIAIDYKSYYEDEVYSAKSTYSYDDYGNIVSETLTEDGETETITYSYTYGDGTLLSKRDEEGTTYFDQYGNAVQYVSDYDHYTTTWELRYYPNGVPSIVEDLIYNVSY